VLKTSKTKEIVRKELGDLDSHGDTVKEIIAIIRSVSKALRVESGKEAALC